MVARKGKRVLFVEGQNARIAVRADLGKDRFHGFDLLNRVGRRSVGHVHYDVSFLRFLKRRFERFHQAVRKMPDEAHRVDEDELLVVFRFVEADSGVKSREELVLDKDVRVGERVHQRRFPGVGVAHQRHGGLAALASRFALQLAVAPDVGELFS